MLLKTLSDGIESAVIEAGYHFYSGSPYRRPEDIKKYPAVWLDPLQLVSMTGIAEGDATVAASIKIMQYIGRNAAEMYGEEVPAVETVLVEIKNTLLEANYVRNISRLNSSYEEISFGSGRLIIQSAEIEIIAPYFNDKAE